MTGIQLYRRLHDGYTAIQKITWRVYSYTEDYMAGIQLYRRLHGGYTAIQKIGRSLDPQLYAASSGY